jgi:hypothetical protein
MSDNLYLFYFIKKSKKQKIGRQKNKCKKQKNALF